MDRDDSLLDMVLSKLYVFGSGVSGLLSSRVSDDDIYMVESLYLVFVPLCPLDVPPFRAG